MDKKVVSILVFISTAVFVLFKIDFGGLLVSSKSLLDFDSYYVLSKDILTGANPYTVSDQMQTLGPPLVILPYLPFSNLPINAGRVLFTAANVLAVFVTCYLLSNNCFAKRKLEAFVILTAILLTSFSARFTLELGQTGIFVALIITLVLFEKRVKVKSILLALLISFKTFFLLSLLAVIRNKEVFFWSIFFLIIVGSLSLFFIDLNWYKYYLTEKFGALVFNNQSISGLDYYNQSFRSTLARIGIGKYYWEILISFALYFAYYSFKSGNILASLVFPIIVSPVSWQHYYVILFPVFVITYKNMEKGPVNLSILGLSLFLWWLEIPVLHNKAEGLMYGILASHYFISGILLFYLTTGLKLPKNKL